MTQPPEISSEQLVEEIKKTKERIEQVQNLLNEEDENSSLQSQRELRVIQILEDKLEKATKVLNSLQEKVQEQEKELVAFKTNLDVIDIYSNLKTELEINQNTLLTFQRSLESIGSKNFDLKKQIVKSEEILGYLIELQKNDPHQSQHSPEEFMNIISDLTTKKIQLENILRQKKKKEEHIVKELKVIELKLTEETEKFLRLQNIVNGEVQEGW